MGVHGLWPLLESTSTSITLNCLEGKKLAIDVSIWLYQAAHGYDSVTVGSRNPHLLLLIRRIAKLLYYKIRPVFVFDGSNIPELKRRVLRGRHLKKHMEMVTLSRTQKKALDKLSKMSTVSDESQCLSIFTKTKDNEINNDIFALPNSTNFQPINEKFEEVVDFFEGYNDLTSNDAKIAFLQEAKEKSRNMRLKNKDISQDSKKFSSLQIERLLNRNKINAQLETLQKERLKQSVNISTDNMKMVVVDNQLNKHILTLDDDVQVLNPEQEERKRVIQESLSWPEFLKQNFNQNNTILEPQSNNNNYEKLKEKFNSLEKNFNQFIDSDNVNKDLYADDWSSESENSDLEDIPLICDLQQSYINKHEKNNDEKKIFFNDFQASSSSVEVNEIDEINEDNELKFFTNSKERYYGEIKHDFGVQEDCEKLFSCLGLPYITAPGEAEAQCVELEKLGLVDGIVSDDSDVWLFGGNVVYKNMFKSVKHVQEYKLQNINEHLGLSRGEFIQLGMLSGGDYSQGFEKVGVVTALELIAEFLSENDSNSNDNLENAIKPLEKIGTWLRTTNKTESTFKTRLRKVIVENNDKETIEKFPNIEVFKAYANPVVNSSNQNFHWHRVNFTKLKDFLWNKIGLDENKISEMTHGAFIKWDNFMCEVRQQFQSRITSFLNKNFIVETSSENAQPTKRLQVALKKLKDAKGTKRKSFDEKLSTTDVSHTLTTEKKMCKKLEQKLPKKKKVVKKKTAKSK